MLKINKDYINPEELTLSSPNGGTLDISEIPEQETEYYVYNDIYNNCGVEKLAKEYKIFSYKNLKDYVES